MKYILSILTLFCLINISCKKDIDIDIEQYTFKPRYVKFNYVVDQSFFNSQNYIFYASHNGRMIHINNIITSDSIFVSDIDQKVHINIYYFTDSCSNLYEIYLNVDKWTEEYKNILVGSFRIYQTDKITISNNPLQINIHKY